MVRLVAFGVAGWAVAACLSSCSSRRDERPPPPPRPDLVAASARVDLTRVERAIRLYAEDRAGRLPSHLDDLASDSSRDTGRTYLGSMPRDPWGQPYSYAILSSRDGTYDLRSYGPDRLPGTGDDVVAKSAPVPVR